MSNLRDDLMAKIKVLSETLWEERARGPALDSWLSNFQDPAVGTVEEQQLHALFLLSRFMYFGHREVREMLRALYRDLYRYPLAARLRRSAANTLDAAYLQNQLAAQLDATRFLGMGNPSESGTHLLYYFRQENGLPRTLFLNTHEVFVRSGSLPTRSLRTPAVRHYVFIDDFCGSGTQAKQYSTDIVEEIKSLDPSVEVCYYVLFATDSGLTSIRNEARFDRVEAIFELDSSYKCFDADSRYFQAPPAPIRKDFAQQMCKHYGKAIEPSMPLGYGGLELLLAFCHNTPDNTLPVIWHSEDSTGWHPMFRRYPKLYK